MNLNLSWLKLMLSDINHEVHILYIGNIFLDNHKWYPVSSDAFHQFPSVLLIVLWDFFAYINEIRSALNVDNGLHW